MDIDKQAVIEKFGINPETIGNRYRGFWIVESCEDEEIKGNAETGFLCVKTRDGGSNPMDAKSCKYANFVGTSEDGFDCTYRYYYYRPLVHQ